MTKEPTVLSRLLDKSIKNQRIKQIIAATIASVCLYFASKLILMGSGFYPVPQLKDILLVSILIIIFNSSKRLFYIFLLPFVTLHALYAPIGLIFGPPSYQYFASVFATDLLESKEFFSQLPWEGYLLSVGIIAFTLLFRLYTQKFQLHFHKNKVFLAIITVFLLFESAPFKFMQESYSSGLKVKNEITLLNNLSIQSHWGKSELVNSIYDDYVLIIGESARKDYHHAYGYPVNNTPFMSSAKGVLIDGFTAGGTNTIASLKLMLTKPDTKNWESNYNLNLIDLIKSAGIQTYWISNQGYLSEFDTPISAIANKSDEKIFLKSGDLLNTNISDFKLLPEFIQVIAQPTVGKRFIVVHLYGSHPITCDRLQDYPKMFEDADLPQKYFNVNCYVSSIKKTDEVLRQLHEELVKNNQKTHRTFSMVYFSDHGLAHHISEGHIAIHNSSGKSKQHYNIPLFKTSSDDTRRNVYKVFKSGLNFTDGIAKWIGIVNPKLNPDADLFSNRADNDDYGLKAQIDKINVPDDPAVIIPSGRK
ncbi:MAG TPA: hypothetical protein DD638_01880 [Pasteurellaceae bacterium]|nr:hypothetical protein [Pasteurellaceae bacterium]